MAAKLYLPMKEDLNIEGLLYNLLYIYIYIYMGVDGSNKIMYVLLIIIYQWCRSQSGLAVSLLLLNKLLKIPITSTIGQHYIYRSNFS